MAKQFTLALAIMMAAVIAAIAIVVAAKRAERPTVRAALVRRVEGCKLRDPTAALRPIPLPPIADAREVALGRLLFHDVRMSSDDSIACSSCHRVDFGGADGRARSAGVGGVVGVINTPTVLNSGLLFALFWDGRAKTLEDQVDGPMGDPGEMGSPWPLVIAKFERDPAMMKRFRELYDDAPQGATIKKALATYERSLLTPDSPFDRWLCGNDAALEPAALRGYELFTEYGCVSCHQGVAIGGNMFQRFGVAGNYFEGRADSRPDRGRFNVTGDDADLHVFKVPSLRNVALTAPYFHDASAPTLEVAVTVMARYQLGRTLPPEDLVDIVAFLQALTGELPRAGP